MDEVRKYVVVDTGAIFTRKSLIDPRITYICPEGVVKEVRDRQSQSLMSAFSDFWQVGTPSKEASKIVTAAARFTGDEDEISEVDRSVIALAVTLCMDNGIKMRVWPAGRPDITKNTEARFWATDSLAVKEGGYSVEVLSGDRSLRNVCFVLGVRAVSLEGREERSGSRVRYECTACRAQEARKGARGCRACGSRQRRVRGPLQGGA